MAHTGEELRLVLARHFEPTALLLNFARALLELLLQSGIGFLQSSRHVVELVGECLQLVPGLDANSLGQVASADALGALAQRLNRSDHAAREKHSGQHGKTERRQQYDAEPLQGGVERRIGLRGWQLDEDQPTEGCHWCIGGEYLAPAD